MVTKAEWAKAYDLAKSDVDLSQHATETLMGYGLPNFRPVLVTIEAFAELIRYQCQYYNGTWDCEALTELHNLSKNRISILG